MICNLKKNKKKNVLSILLENEYDSLFKVIGVFSQRGYNIKSMTMNPTKEKNLLCIIIKTIGTKKYIKKIIQQLKKLINVYKIKKI